MHKNRFNDVFEIASLLNLSFLSSVTFFITEDKESQNVVAYISTGVGFGTFLAILAYHTYKFILEKRFTTKCSKCLHKLQGSQKQLPLQTTVPVISDEQPASKTEIDALPEPENTNAADLDGTDTETSEGTAQYIYQTLTVTLVTVILTNVTVSIVTLLRTIQLKPNWNYQFFHHAMS